MDFSWFTFNRDLQQDTAHEPDHVGAIFSPYKECDADVFPEPCECLKILKAAHIITTYANHDDLRHVRTIEPLRQRLDDIYRKLEEGLYQLYPEILYDFRSLVRAYSDLVLTRKLWVNPDLYRNVLRLYSCYERELMKDGSLDILGNWTKVRRPACQAARQHDIKPLIRCWFTPRHDDERTPIVYDPKTNTYIHDVTSAGRPRAVLQDEVTSEGRPLAVLHDVTSPGRPRAVLQGEVTSAGHSRAVLRDVVTPAGRSRVVLRDVITPAGRSRVVLRDVGTPAGRSRPVLRDVVTPAGRSRAVLREVVTPAGRSRAVLRDVGTPAGHSRAVLRDVVTSAGRSRPVLRDVVTSAGRSRPVLHDVTSAGRSRAVLHDVVEENSEGSSMTENIMTSTPKSSPNAYNVAVHNL